MASTLPARTTATATSSSNASTSITTRPPVGLAGAVPARGPAGRGGDGTCSLGEPAGFRVLRLSWPFLRRRQVRPSGCAGGSGAGHHGLGALGPLRADLPARQLRLRWVMPFGGGGGAFHPLLIRIGGLRLGNPGVAYLGDLSVSQAGRQAGLCKELLKQSRSIHIQRCHVTGWGPDLLAKVGSETLASKWASSCC